MMKRIISIITVVILCVGMVGTASATVAIDRDGYRHVKDYAGLLTDEEIVSLGVKLSGISQRLEADIVVVTDRGLGDLQSYAEDYYDDNDYGDSGVLLLYCDNEVYITTIGGCQYALDYDRQDEIFDAIADDISSGYYSDAFTTFGELCETYIGSYVSANGPLSQYENSVELFGFRVRIEWYHLLLLAVIVGVIVGFIAVTSMKSKLRSVRYNSRANDYIMRDTMSVTMSREIFLYRNVTRVARPQNNSRGGRGGFGGGGRRHSGSGRKF